MKSFSLCLACIMRLKAARKWPIFIPPLCYMVVSEAKFPGLFQALIERGEKLSDLEVRTEQMNVRAKAFADAAYQMQLKYKDKKWYQV